MAWDGTVMRRVSFVTPREDGCVITLECRHVRLSRRPPLDVLQRREYPCDVCSRPSRQRLLETRACISFDEVLRLLAKGRS